MAVCDEIIKREIEAGLATLEQDLPDDAEVANDAEVADEYAITVPALSKCKQFTYNELAEKVFLYYELAKKVSNYQENGKKLKAYETILYEIINLFPAAIHHQSKEIDINSESRIKFFKKTPATLNELRFNNYSDLATVENILTLYTAIENEIKIINSELDLLGNQQNFDNKTATTSEPKTEKTQIQLKEEESQTVIFTFDIKRICDIYDFCTKKDIFQNITKTDFMKYIETANFISIIENAHTIKSKLQYLIFGMSKIMGEAWYSKTAMSMNTTPQKCSGANVNEQFKRHLKKVIPELKMSPIFQN